MAGIFEELKYNFRRPNNTLIQLILINVIVFVFIALLWVVERITSGDNIISSAIYKQFTIPPTFREFITRPWTIITYAFAHSLGDIFHILFNMLFLYWFGKIILEYMGSQRVLNLYILGALSGALLYLVAFNLIPYYESRIGFPGMVGASAAVYAVSVAAATLRPDYQFFMIFLGPVKIKYIVAFFIFTSTISLVGPNEGGNLAHLGGAFMGWFYIRRLQRGTDLGSWISNLMDFFRGLFKPKSKIRVSHRNTAPRRNTASTAGAGKADQAEIDAILDKISEKGYESLSKEEKQKLFNASRK